MAKELSWEEHIENLKRRLEVDPRIVYHGDPEFDGLVKPYGGMRPGWNGSYLWKLGENTIILMRKGRVGTLAHEFKHAAQYKNREAEGFEFDHNEPLDFKAKFSDYASSKKEDDANKFAREYCKEHGLNANAAEISLNVRVNKTIAPIAKIFGK